MLHNRFGSDLRAHFSTVGPSPLTRSSHFPPTQTSPYPEPASKLVLLPAPASSPARPDSDGAPHSAPSVKRDLLSAAAHRCASFFAEAAVLVFVLGILDRFMLKGRFELGWSAAASLIALALLAASIGTDVSARRWLRPH